MVQVPQVTIILCVTCGMGTGSTVTGRAGSRKQSISSGREHEKGAAASWPRGIGQEAES